MNLLFLYSQTHFSRGIFSLSILLSLAACTLGPAPSAEDTHSESRGVVSGPFGNLEERMKIDRVPGVSVAVIKNYEIDWAQGFGNKRAGSEDPVTPQTLFPASSISKAVTATLAVDLAQQGLLRLDESINRQLTSWQIPDNEFTESSEVTLLNLLDHTGCVNRPPGGFSYEGGYPTTLEILNGTPPATNPSVQIECIPGSEIRYSNFGYIIVQQVIEDVSNLSFRKLAQERVFGPVGMTSSTFEQPLPEQIEDRAAFPHWSEGEPGPRTYSPNALGQGGLWTTPTDLARFAIEVMKARIGEKNSSLRPKLVGQLLTPHHRGLEGGAFWGLGFVLAGDWGFLQAGSDPGFRSMMVAFPTLGDGIVIMVNGEEGELLQLRLLGNFLMHYIFMPRIGSILLGFVGILFLVSALLVWPAGFLAARFRRWRTGAYRPDRDTRPLPLRARLIASVAAILILVLAYPYLLYAFDPVGPLRWSGGSYLSKVLIAVSLAAAILSMSLIFFSVRAWKDRFWSRKGRLHYFLVTASALAASFLWLDLLDLL